MPYISKKQLAELRKIARIATMNSASFGFDNERFEAPIEHFGIHTTTNPDEFIKARTCSWRNSWIVDPLNEICDAIEKKG